MSIDYSKLIVIHEISRAILTQSKVLKLVPKVGSLVFENALFLHLISIRKTRRVCLESLNIRLVLFKSSHRLDACV